LPTPLPTLNFLTSDPNYTDYRPAVNSAGNTVVFERRPVSGGVTTLYVIKDLGNPNPVPFLSGTPLAQSRPDWCWTTDNILFNDESINVWLVGGDGSNPTKIGNTTGAYYPTWNLAGTQFVTENTGTTASPNPCNTIFNLGGSLQSANVDGTSSAQATMFGGMPAVGPSDLPLIAYAGQPAIAGWNGPGRIKYNEANNYIFLNQSTNGGFTSTPMEQDAPVGSFVAAYEGRAPNWSPDGTMIAFESNRSGLGYAIYLYNLKTKKVTQVTDPSLSGQHAKFFHDGSKLVLCINHPGGTPATMGIAWVDLSTLL
jgi:Tol biopolymer transport system component